MRVWIVTLERLCGGRVGDFDLPRVLGYFADERSARIARDADMTVRGTRPIGEMVWTAPDDYRIDAVAVMRWSDEIGGMVEADDSDSDADTGAHREAE